MAERCVWQMEDEHAGERCGKQAVYEGVQDAQCPMGPPLYCLEHGDQVRRYLDRSLTGRFGRCYCEELMHWVIGLRSAGSLNLGGKQ